MSANGQDGGGCGQCLGCLGMLLLFPMLWSMNPLLAIIIVALYLGSSSTQTPHGEGS